MIIPKIARYNYCCAKANEFLIKENINNLPFDSDKIIKKHKWSKLKYSELAKKHNVDISDIVEAYESEDGYSIFNGKNYSIAYNDTIKTKQRIYFTKLHEIGHIYLRHFLDFEQTILKRSDMTEEEYKVLENEANCFARNVLVPITLIEELKIKCPARISVIFGITPSASNTRFHLSKNDLYYFSNNNLQDQKNLFHDFIYKNQCLQCGHSFISENAKFCPICGRNRLTWGDGKMKYNDGYDLNTNGKANTCPKCENEETRGTGDYCKICGSNLVNKCTNLEGIFGEDYNGNQIIIKNACGELAEGNARYCEYCGEATTFFNQNLLDEWQIAKPEIERSANERDPDYIPF